MFGKPSGNGGPPPPQQPEQGEKRLPPLREWTIRRIDPLDAQKIETRVVRGHGLEYGRSLAVLKLVESPDGNGYMQQIELGWASYIDFQEHDWPERPSLIH